MKQNLILLLVLCAFLVGCKATGNSATPSRTPTQTYQEMVAAIKSSDVGKFKSLISKSALALIQGSAKKKGKSLDDELKSFMKETPVNNVQFRNETISGNRASVEGNSGSGWSKTWFTIEDGEWKLALDK